MALISLKWTNYLSSGDYLRLGIYFWQTRQLAFEWLFSTHCLLPFLFTYPVSLKEKHLNIPEYFTRERAYCKKKSSVFFCLMKACFHAKSINNNTQFIKLIYELLLELFSFLVIKENSFLNIYYLGITQSNSYKIYQNVLFFS